MNLSLRSSQGRLFTIRSKQPSSLVSIVSWLSSTHIDREYITSDPNELKNWATINSWARWIIFQMSYSQYQECARQIGLSSFPNALVSVSDRPLELLLWSIRIDFPSSFRVLDRSLEVPGCIARSLGRMLDRSIAWSFGRAIVAPTCVLLPWYVHVLWSFIHSACMWTTSATFKPQQRLSINGKDSFLDNWCWPTKYSHHTFNLFQPNWFSKRCRLW